MFLTTSRNAAGISSPNRISQTEWNSPQHFGQNLLKASGNDSFTLRFSGKTPAENAASQTPAPELDDRAEMKLESLKGQAVLKPAEKTIVVPLLLGLLDDKDVCDQLKAIGLSPLNIRKGVSTMLEGAPKPLKNSTGRTQGEGPNTSKSAPPKAAPENPSADDSDDDFLANLRKQSEDRLKDLNKSKEELLALQSGRKQPSSEPEQTAAPAPRENLVSDQDIQQLKKSILEFAQQNRQTLVTPLTIWHYLMQDTENTMARDFLELGGEVKPEKLDQLRQSSASAISKPTVATKQDTFTVENIEKMEKALAEVPQRIVGQESALQEICNSIIESQFGYDEDEGKPTTTPASVQLLLGPSGVGKTAGCEALAEALGRPVIYVPMNQYNDEQNVARIYGAAPGYTGYGEGGSLVDAVLDAKRKCAELGAPPPIMIMDEIEKAHDKIFDALMQMFDKGILESSDGKHKATFEGIDILITSNIAQKKINAAKAAGKPLEEIKAITKTELEGHFRPEFIGRLTNIITFNTLERKHAREILDKQYLAKLERSVKKSDNIDLKIDNDLRELLVDLGYSEKYGVRELKKAVRTTLKTELTKIRIQVMKTYGKMIPGEYHAYLKDKHLQIDFTPAPQK